MKAWVCRMWGCAHCGQVNSDEFYTCGACRMPKGG